MLLHAKELTYDLIKVDDFICLYIDMEIKPDTIPDGFYSYHTANLRPGAEYISEIHEICIPEKQQGSLLSKHAFSFGEAGTYIPEKIAALHVEIMLQDYNRFSEKELESCFTDHTSTVSFVLKELSSPDCYRANGMINGLSEDVFIQHLLQLKTVHQIWEQMRVFGQELMEKGYVYGSGRYDTEDIPDALLVERFQEAGLFKTNWDACRKAERDGELFINNLDGLEKGYYVDTPENRMLCEETLLLHPELRVENWMDILDGDYGSRYAEHFGMDEFFDTKEKCEQFLAFYRDDPFYPWQEDSGLLLKESFEQPLVDDTDRFCSLSILDYSFSGKQNYSFLVQKFLNDTCISRKEYETFPEANTAYQKAFEELKNQDISAFEERKKPSLMDKISDAQAKISFEKQSGFTENQICK